MKASKLKEMLDGILATGADPEIRINHYLGKTPLFLLQNKDDDSVAWFETVNDIDLLSELEAQQQHIEEMSPNEKMTYHESFAKAVHVMHELGVKGGDYTNMIKELETEEIEIIFKEYE